MTSPYPEPETPSAMLSWPTVHELAEIGELKHPRILMRNGEFIPVFYVGKTDVCIRKQKSPFPVTFQGLNGARNTLYRLGFKPSEIHE